MRLDDLRRELEELAAESPPAPHDAARSCVPRSAVCGRVACSPASRHWRSA